MSLREIKPWGIVIYCIPIIIIGLWVSSIETFLDTALFVVLGVPLLIQLGGWANVVVHKWFIDPEDEFVPPITK